MQQQIEQAVRVDVPAWPKDHTPNPKSRVEVPQAKKYSHESSSRQHFPRLVTTYAIARLAQYVNSRLHYGWTGSRAEQRHCEAWNLKPVPVQL